MLAGESAAIIDVIAATAQYQGNKDAKITWIEYTDVNCHYCQKMQQDGTSELILGEYPDLVNKTVSNFIGVGGAGTQTAAEILECSAKLSGAKAYNEILIKALSSGNTSKSDMLSSAEDFGVNRDALESCVNNGETKEIVKTKFEIGQSVFGVTGTPGNIILNNQTGEYHLISGAYPAEEFRRVIESLK